MNKSLNDIIKSAESSGYTIDKRPYKLNLIGVRNSEATNQDKFDDLIAYFYYDNKGKLVGKVGVGTTDPSTFWLYNPMNDAGAAILKSGEYKDSWEIGVHRGKYVALVQKKPVTVIRDDDRNSLINYFAPTYKGVYGINIHKSSLGKDNVNYIDKDSAGCQVFRDVSDFDSMMTMANISREKYGNEFSYILLDERDMLKLFNTTILGIGFLLLSYYLYKKAMK